MPEKQVVVCTYCDKALNVKDFSDLDHRRCLTGSIWSEVPSLQVLSCRILCRLKETDWTAEVLSGAHIEEQLIEWMEAETRVGVLTPVHKMLTVRCAQGDP